MNEAIEDSLSSLSISLYRMNERKPIVKRWTILANLRRQRIPQERGIFLAAIPQQASSECGSFLNIFLEFFVVTDSLMQITGIAQFCIKRREEYFGAHAKQRNHF